MNRLRKGIALLLLLTLCVGNALPATAFAADQGAAAAASGTETAGKTDPEQSSEKTPDSSSSQSAKLTARVEAAAPSYEVEIPSGLDLGRLVPNQDYQKDFTVSVVMRNSRKGDRIQVTADEKTCILHRPDAGSRDALEAGVRFGTDGTHVFQATGSEKGRITIPGRQIAAAAPGQYTGVLNFTIRCLSDGTGPDVPVKPDPGKDPAPQPENPDTGEKTCMTAPITLKTTDYTGRVSEFDGLLHRTAYLTMQGGQLELVFYLVDPVPAYADQGAGSRIQRLTYQGSTPPFRADYTDRKLVPFDAVPGRIEAAGEYPATRVTVTLPGDALADIVNQNGLLCQADFDLPDGASSSFYIVLGEPVDVPSLPAFPDAPNGQKPVDPPSPEKPDTDPTREPETKPDTTDPAEPEKPARKTFYSVRAVMQHETKDMPSMCDGLFHRYAYVTVTGEKAELLFYVINPIPGFADQGEPVRDVFITYDGQNYPVSIDYSESRLVSFEEKPTFIKEAGTYPAAPVKVTIPAALFEKAVAGELLPCQAFVNAVMNTDVVFRIALSERKPISALPSFPDADGGRDPSAPSDPSRPSDPSDPSRPSDPSNPSDPSGPADPQPPLPPDNPPVPGGTTDGIADGSYTADVSMRNETSFGKESMCDPLFFARADITVSGGNASVRLYVINPVPAFPEAGTPIRDFSVRYNGRSSTGSVSAAGSGTKYFARRDGFIPESGNYPYSTVSFNLPVSAIRDSASKDKGVMAHCFVNAVMNRYVDFYIVFSGLKGGSTPSGGPAARPGSSDSGNRESELFREDGAYNASVSMRHAGDFEKPSMCDPLFYPRADITVKGDGAQVTFYVIDPIPKFSGEENRPPVRNIRLHYGGKEYPGEFAPGGDATRHFAAAPGFIETEGDYTFGTVKVTLPVKAIGESADKKLTCTAYVNAVMKTDVEFYVVFGDVKDGPAEAAGEAQKEELLELTLEPGEPRTFEAPVSMRRADDLQKGSMCDPLFYEKAEVVISGNTAELTLFIIDPVPKFAEEGTPLSDVRFLYDGRAYAAKQAPLQVTRQFAQAPGFIPEAGEYPATPVKAVLPRAAIEGSPDGKLMCSAYVNTVMHTTQEFYVVLGELTEVETVPEETEPEGPIRIGTTMVPAILAGVLVTAILLGCGFVWLRRR